MVVVKSTLTFIITSGSACFDFSRRDKGNNLRTSVG